MARITIFTAGGINHYKMSFDDGATIDQALAEGSSVTIRLAGDNANAAAVVDVDPRRHSWDWEWQSDGTPGPMTCRRCGVFAGYSGHDTHCEDMGYACPPTVFDESDHLVSCPQYRARPCIPAADLPPGWERCPPCLAVPGQVNCGGCRDLHRDYPDGAYGIVMPTFHGFRWALHEADDACVVAGKAKTVTGAMLQADAAKIAGGQVHDHQ